MIVRQREEHAYGGSQRTKERTARDTKERKDRQKRPKKKKCKKRAEEGE
jgi:hypothetical protein